jgi:hypothetical protein
MDLRSVQSTRPTISTFQWFQLIVKATSDQSIFPPSLSVPPTSKGRINTHRKSSQLLINCMTSHRKNSKDRDIIALSVRISYYHIVDVTRLL